jgi:hypothetical protein
VQNQDISGWLLHRLLISSLGNALQSFRVAFTMPAAPVIPKEIRDENLVPRARCGGIADDGNRL